MKYEVILTDQADKDVREVYEYIAYSLFEPGIALKQISRIEKAIKSLDKMPNRYRLYKKEPWYSIGLHQMPVDNYIIFYIVNNDERHVAIIRVMHGGRDIDEQLKDF